MTVTPIAGDSQLAAALSAIGATALGDTRNDLIKQAIVAAANGGGAGGATAWGSITGTLANQTDLSNALAAKLALAGGTMTGDLILSTLAFLRTNTNGALSFGASDDVKIGRGGGAGVLQLGVDHATVATPQTLKAHDVAGGAGASLTLKGGGGGAEGALYLASSASELVGFYGNATAQIDTSGTAAAFTESSGTTLNENSTWDNYTIAVVIKALRTIGILA